MERIGMVFIFKAECMKFAHRWIAKIRLWKRTKNLNKQEKMHLQLGQKRMWNLRHCPVFSDRRFFLAHFFSKLVFFIVHFAHFRIIFSNKLRSLQSLWQNYSYRSLLFAFSLFKSLVLSVMYLGFRRSFVHFRA